MASTPESAPARLYFTSIGSLKIKTDCSRLKQTLVTLGVEFEEVDLSMDKSLRAEMIEASGGEASLPQLHAGGKFIGLFEDVQEMVDEGVLVDMLKG